MIWKKISNIKGEKGQDGIPGESIIGPPGKDAENPNPNKVLHRTLKIPTPDIGQDLDWCFNEMGELFNKRKGKWDFYAQIGSDSAGSGRLSGHVIQGAGTAITQRPNLNFTTGLSASDNAGTNASDVIVNQAFDFTWTGSHTWSGHTNTVPITISGQTVTGSNTTRALSISTTWNTTGNATALRVAVTNTASNASSSLFQLLGGAGGATNRFRVGVDGLIAQNVGVTDVANPIGYSLAYAATFASSATTATSYQFSGLTQMNFGSNGTLFQFNFIPTFRVGGTAAQMNYFGISVAPTITSVSTSASPHFQTIQLMNVTVPQLGPSTGVPAYDFRATNIYMYRAQAGSLGGNISVAVTGYEFTGSDGGLIAFVTPEVSAFKIAAGVWGNFGVGVPTEQINDFFGFVYNPQVFDAGAGSICLAEHGFAIAATSNFALDGAAVMPTLYWSNLVGDAISASWSGITNLLPASTNNTLAFQISSAGASAGSLISIMGVRLDGATVLDEKYLYWAPTVSTNVSASTARIRYTTTGGLGGRLEFYHGITVRAYFNSSYLFSLGPVQITSVANDTALSISEHTFSTSGGNVLTISTTWSTSLAKVGFYFNETSGTYVTNAGDRAISCNNAGTEKFGVYPHGQVSSKYAATETSTVFSYPRSNYLASFIITANTTAATTWTAYAASATLTIANSNTHTYTAFSTGTTLISSGAFTPTTNFIGYESKGFFVLDSLSSGTITHFKASGSVVSTDSLPTLTAIRGFHSVLGGFTTCPAIDAFLGEFGDNGVEATTVTDFAYFHGKPTAFTTVGSAITNFYGLHIEDSTDTEITNKWGFSVGMDSLIKRDKYLYWGSATTTVLASRDAGIRWNNTGTTLDFEIGTTVKLALSSTVLTFSDAVNIAFNATTGTKLGTATSQKLSLWNKTPIIQPAAANQAALTNSTGGSYDGTLVDVGIVFSQANINNNFTDLHTLVDEIRTALVNVGVMKGSA